MINFKTVVVTPLESRILTYSDFNNCLYYVVCIINVNNLNKFQYETNIVVCLEIHESKVDEIEFSNVFYSNRQQTDLYQ